MWEHTQSSCHCQIATVFLVFDLWTAPKLTPALVRFARLVLVGIGRYWSVLVYPDEQTTGLLIGDNGDNGDNGDSGDNGDNGDNHCRSHHFQVHPLIVAELSSRVFDVTTVATL